jgi:outer membrane protein OmpA-like peptidoglycan-associated protein
VKMRLKVLDEVAAFLIENRNVKISLSSSTDSRATAEYNEKLSHNRSKSARQYLDRQRCQLQNNWLKYRGQENLFW